MEIKNRFTCEIIYKDDSKTLKKTVENAILAKVDQRYSNLIGSDLRYSNLIGSNLRWSDLRGSNLSGSNLRWSNLSGSNLSGSNLRYSNLSGSNLSGSNLRWSNLSYCDLSGSNLSGSNLSYSNLSGCIGLDYAQMSFAGFGEKNRLITLVDVNRDDNPIFFCGCFKGTNEELIKYIEDGEEKYKESRHFARTTLLEAIKFSNNKNK